jgi:hypothetical protein
VEWERERLDGEKSVCACLPVAGASKGDGQGAAREGNQLIHSKGDRVLHKALCVWTCVCDSTVMLSKIQAVCFRREMLDGEMRACMFYSVVNAP